jgi:hypothetical protein
LDALHKLSHQIHTLDAPEKRLSKRGLRYISILAIHVWSKICARDYHVLSRILICFLLACIKFLVGLTKIPCHPKENKMARIERCIVVCLPNPQGSSTTTPSHLEDANIQH